MKKENINFFILRKRYVLKVILEIIVFLLREIICYRDFKFFFIIVMR